MMSVSSLALFAFLLSHQGLAYLLDRACEGHIELGLKVTLGTDARGMDTAWMASLYNSENKFICGGTLITNLFVLTAGHCLVDKLRFVRLGEKDRSCKTSNCEVVREYTVSRVIPHPRFRPNFFPIVYDIGLIKLNETVDYNDSIRPICIIVDSAVHFPNNIQGRAYGWGKTNSSAQVFSDIIMSITLTRTRQKNCSYLPVKNDQFCAVSSNGGDTCTGDSGGPLAADYVYQGTKSYVQIGIVSFGSPNCNNKGVYTNVESYQDWIVEMVEKYNDTLLFEECSSQMHGVFAVRLWEVSLRSTIKGTLITDRFVLTVARDLRTDATTIIARIKDSYVSVLKIDKHPDYSPSKPKRNNIALLELAQKVIFSELLKPICLQLNSIPSKTLTGVLYGNNFSDLQNQTLTRIDDSLCSTKTKMQVRPDQFCVEKPRTFLYDLPGSVVGTYKKVNGFDRYLLVGIISHIKNGVIVYTYIPSYLDWITKKVVYKNKTMHPEQTSRPPLNRHELAYRTDVSGK